MKCHSNTALNLLSPTNCFYGVIPAQAGIHTLQPLWFEHEGGNKWPFLLAKTQRMDPRLREDDIRSGTNTRIFLP